MNNRNIAFSLIITQYLIFFIIAFLFQNSVKKIFGFSIFILIPFLIIILSFLLIKRKLVYLIFIMSLSLWASIFGSLLVDKILTSKIKYFTYVIILIFNFIVAYFISKEEKITKKKLNIEDD